MPSCLCGHFESCEVCRAYERERVESPGARVDYGASIPLASLSTAADRERAAGLLDPWDTAVAELAAAKVAMVAGVVDRLHAAGFSTLTHDHGPNETRILDVDGQLLATCKVDVDAGSWSCGLRYRVETTPAVAVVLRRRA